MKRLRKALFVGSALVAGFFALLIGQYFLPGPRIKVAKNTTVLTEPLAAGGLPDYAAYFLKQGRDGVTPENNGAIPFLRAMWPAGLEPNEQRELCAHLGMEIPASPGLIAPQRDPSLKRAIEAWRDRENKPANDDYSGETLQATETYPWKRDEWPPVAEWIDRHAAQFDMLHTATGLAKFYGPSPTFLVAPEAQLYEAQWPVMRALQAATACLQTRAMMFLGEGDIAAAWSDCQTIYALADRTYEGMLVGTLHSLAIDKAGNEVALSILDSPHLTPEVARQLLHYYNTRPGRASVARAIDHERLGFVTAVIAMSKKGAFESQLDKLGGDGSLSEWRGSVDWNQVLKLGNGWYDRFAQVAGMENWRERQTARQAVEGDIGLVDDRVRRELSTLRESIARLGQARTATPAAAAQVPERKGLPPLLSRSARSQLLGDYVIRLFLPSLEGILTAEERATTQRQLHTLAAALALYRLQQGVYPEQCDALVPELLPAMPTDGYGRPIAYHRTPDGYLLYSSGPNGTDDKGSNAAHDQLEGRTLVVKNRDSKEGQQILNQIPPGADDCALRLPVPSVPLVLPSR